MRKKCLAILLVFLTIHSINVHAQTEKTAAEIMEEAASNKSKKKSKSSDSKKKTASKKERQKKDANDQNEKVKLNVDSEEGAPADWGIVSEKAPKLDVNYWWDEKGNKADVYLSNYLGQVVIIFCWQDWCPACSKHGYKELQELQEKYQDHPNVQFLAVQTVFEGAMQNSKKKVLKMQQEYKLDMPVGYDIGSSKTNYQSSIMKHYRTAGTPWFIVIDQSGKVIYNYHHLTLEASKEVVGSLLK